MTMIDAGFKRTYLGSRIGRDPGRDATRSYKLAQATLKGSKNSMGP
jgi:hypothetical protein